MGPYPEGKHSAHSRQIKIYLWITTSVWRKGKLHLIVKGKKELYDNLHRKNIYLKKNQAAACCPQNNARGNEL